VNPGDLVKVVTESVYSSGQDLKDRVGLVLEVEEPDGILELESQVLVMFDNMYLWFYRSELSEVSIKFK
jgi:hypothetical protein